MEKQNFNINASDHPLIAAKQTSGGPWGRPVVFCFLIWRACYFMVFMEILFVTAQHASCLAGYTFPLSCITSDI